MKQRKVHIVAVQEARPTKAGITEDDDWITIATESDQLNGHGCEIWINKRLPFSISSHDNDQGEQEEYKVGIDDVEQLHADPRRLIVEISTAALDAVIINTHAPGQQWKELVPEWWSATREQVYLIREARPKKPVLWLQDGNIDEDGRVAHGVRTAAYKYVDEMLQTIEKCNMTNLLKDEHWLRYTKNERATYIGHDATSTIDYIWISEGVKYEPKSLQIWQTYDMHNAAPDHLPLAAQVWLPTVWKQAAKRRRVVPYDRNKANHPTPEQWAEVERRLQLLPKIPACVDVSTHLQILDDGVLQILVEVFPKGRRPRKPEHLQKDTCDTMDQLANFRARARSWSRAAGAAVKATFHWWHDRTLLYSKAYGFRNRSDCYNAAIMMLAVYDLEEQVDVLVKRDEAALLNARAQPTKEALQSGNIIQIHKAVKRTKKLKKWKPRQPVAIEGMHGELITDLRGSRVRWRQQWQGLMKGRTISMTQLVGKEREEAKMRKLKYKYVKRQPSLFFTRHAIARKQKQAVPFKGVGENRTGTEVQKRHATTLSKVYAPLHFKMTARIQSPIQFKGGMIIEFYKGKGLRVLCDAYRDLNLTNASAKPYSACLRQAFKPAMQKHAVDTQCGSGLGAATTSMGHIYVRAAMDVCAVRGWSSAIVFIDVLKAFPNLMRAILFSTPDSDERLFQRLIGMDMPKEVAEAVIETLKENVTWLSDPENAHLHSLLEEKHENTWASLEYLSGVSLLEEGAVTGTSLADGIYSAANATVMKRLRNALDEAELTMELRPTTVDMFSTEESQEGHIWAQARKVYETSYIDDGAQPVGSPSQEIVEKATRTMCITDTVLRCYGMFPNYEKGKSAITFSWHGPGSQAARRQFEAGPGAGQYVEFTRPGGQVVRTWVAQTYPHLGTKTNGDADIAEEVKNKTKGIRGAGKEISKFIAMNSGISDAAAKTMVLAHTMMAGLFQAGAWPRLLELDKSRLHASIMSVYRRRAPTPVYGGEWLTDKQVLEIVELPAPQLLVMQTRLHMLVKVVTLAPTRVRLALSEAAPARRSWVKAVEEELSWAVKNLPEYDSMKVQPDAPGPLFTDNRKPPGIQAWITKVQNNPAQTKMEFDKIVWKPESSQKQEWTKFAGRRDEGGELQCPHCPARYVDRRDLGVHMAQKHGQGAAMRSKVDGSVCACCVQQFWQVERLVKHLEADSPKCQLYYSTFIPEMDEDTKMEVQLRWRDEVRGLTTKGLRRAKATKVHARCEGPLEKAAYLLGLKHKGLLRHGLHKGKEDTQSLEESIEVLVEYQEEHVKSAHEHEQARTEAQYLRMALHKQMCAERKWRAACGLDRSPNRWQAMRIFLVVCSGPEGADDVATAVEQEADRREFSVVCFRLDPIVLPERDACDVLVGTGWEKLARDGKLAGLFASPPCATVSRRRHYVQPGVFARPLRPRANVFSCLPNRTKKEQAQVTIGSHLFLWSLRMAVVLTKQGKWAGLEGPGDPGCEPFPSWWYHDTVTATKAASRVALNELDQCRYGAKVRKHTTIWTGCGDGQTNGTLQLRCNCTKPHEFDGLFEEVNGEKIWASTKLARYPEQLAKTIAKAAVTRMLVGDLPPSEMPDIVHPCIFPATLHDAVMRCVGTGQPQRGSTQLWQM